MSGGSVGGALGTGAGLLLAPETGGASLAIPAAMGALGGGLGSMATGGGNPMSAALMGGLGGLLGGATMGGQDIGGLGDILGGGSGTAANSAAGLGDSALTAADNSATQQAANMAGSAAGNAAVQGPITDMGGVSNLISSLNGGSGATGAASASNAVSGVANAADSSGSGFGSNILGSLQKSISKNPLPYLGLGTSLIGALQPAQGNKINYGQAMANQQQMNPGFYANLPKYNFTTQTNAPSGDWYTYGQRPQQAMYTSQLTPAKTGGLVQAYAKGGKVCGFAMGGMPDAGGVPAGNAPPMGAPAAAPMPQAPESPLAALAGAIQKAPPQQAAQIGHQIGQAVRNHIVKSAMFSGEGPVKGAGAGQDDAVPAKLSDGEYVVPADAVAHLGDGSSDAGAQKLTGMVKAVRAHKATAHAGFPPRSKSPLSYIKKGGA